VLICFIAVVNGTDDMFQDVMGDIDEAIRLSQRRSEPPVFPEEYSTSNRKSNASDYENGLDDILAEMDDLPGAGESTARSEAGSFGRFGATTNQPRSSGPVRSSFTMTTTAPPKPKPADDDGLDDLLATLNAPVQASTGPRSAAKQRKAASSRRNDLSPTPRSRMSTSLHSRSTSSSSLAPTPPREQKHASPQKKKSGYDPLEDLLNNFGTEMNDAKGGDVHDTRGICYVCRKPVRMNEKIVKAMGKAYHQDCFCCIKCGAKNKSFYEFEGQLYCEPCYKTACCHKCGGCGQAMVSGKALKAMGQTWHRACFVCQRCSKPMAGVPFYPIGNKPCCKECFPHVQK